MKKRFLGIIWLACSLGVAGSGYMAWDEAHGHWRKSFQQQAEELGAFVKRCLASRSDLPILERFTEVAQRDDIAWVLMLDPAGKVAFSNKAAEIGTVLDSPGARAALSVTTPITVDVSGLGLVEADVPLGSYGVLRVAGSPASLAMLDRWIMICSALGAVALLAAGWVNLTAEKS